MLWGLDPVLEGLERNSGAMLGGLECVLERNSGSLLGGLEYIPEGLKRVLEGTLSR